MLGNDNVAVIAEIGINHNGDMNVAKKLIDLAVEAGCDAVKFQKRTLDEVYTQEELDTPRESPWGTTNREQKAGLEFGKEEYDEIDRYCKEQGILWSASAWDIDSQKFLQQYDLQFNKIASALLTHDELLHIVAAEGKHTFVSTGMSTLEEVDHAVDIFREHKCPFTVMHCTSTYPTDISESNISCIATLRARYSDSVGIGYSGHEKGVLPTILAVASGANVVERHITTDRTMYGSDQAASLEPIGIKRLCRDAKEVRTIMGNGEKVVYISEIPIIKKLRKY